MTYNTRRLIINYAASVWSTNLSDTNYRNIQYTQNESLRMATGCHKMSSAKHLHVEENVLKVREHSELLSAQYLVRCLDVSNSITTRDAPMRRKKDTLFTRHHITVEPIMIAKDMKVTLQAIYTNAVNQAVNSQERNFVLDDHPPLINNPEKYLTRKERMTLTQLRSGHCRLLKEQNEYKC